MFPGVFNFNLQNREIYKDYLVREEQNAGLSKDIGRYIDKHDWNLKTNSYFSLGMLWTVVKRSRIFITNSRICVAEPGNCSNLFFLAITSKYINPVLTFLHISCNLSSWLCSWKKNTKNLHNMNLGSVSWQCGLGPYRYTVTIITQLMQNSVVTLIKSVKY